MLRSVDAGEAGRREAAAWLATAVQPAKDQASATLCPGSGAPGMANDGVDTLDKTPYVYSNQGMVRQAR